MQNALVDTVTKITRRVRANGRRTLPYALGRFYTVRRVYSLQQRILRGNMCSSETQTLFPGVEIADAVRCLKDDAVFRRVRIPSEYVHELQHFAKTQPLTSENGPAGFRYTDVDHGRLGTGQQLVWAHVRDVHRHPAAKAISGDSVAMAVMARYLGYTPRFNIRMYWSFVASADVTERQQAGQTVEYHYDTESYNFAYAAYYLTDTNENTGAHVMVTGSHRDKPFRWLLGSVRRSDEAIESHYRSGRIIAICGSAGDGFWQDSSCYHKALAPKTADRLLLQVRYY